MANHSGRLKLVSAAFVNKCQPVTVTPPLLEETPIESGIISFSLVLLFIHSVAYKDKSMFSLLIPNASLSPWKIRERSVP